MPSGTYFVYKSLNTDLFFYMNTLKPIVNSDVQTIHFRARYWIDTSDSFLNPGTQYGAITYGPIEVNIVTNCVEH